MLVRIHAEMSSGYTVFAPFFEAYIVIVGRQPRHPAQFSLEPILVGRKLEKRPHKHVTGYAGKTVKV